jgi:hypothetical protein
MSAQRLRELPVDYALASALRVLKIGQTAERLAAGEAYIDTGYVVVERGG